MIRNFKALGLALVAMLAMSAVVASTAMAESTTHKLTAQDGTYPESFHGSNTAGNEVFTTEAGNMECDSTFSGELGEATQTIAVTPVYTNCGAFGFLNATVSMNGCHYLFHLTTRTALHQYDAHVDVACPAGKVITIVVSTCEATIPAQTGLTAVDLENMTGGKNDITVTATVNKQIKYNVTKDGFLCPYGGTGAKEGASYTASVPVTITSAQGIDIG